MKVAILTQPLRTNFGGILQNFALQKVLRDLGHTPITVDYDCVYPRWRWLIGRVKSLLLNSPHNVEFPHYGRSGQEKLNKFISEKINTTQPKADINKSTLVKLHPDIILVGSDQVWSPICNVPIKYLGNMFLDFWPDFPGKRIAYGASFGGTEWLYTAEQNKIYGKLVKKFSAVSVREASGVKLCLDHFGIKAKHVLDPTLLLTVSDYESLIPFEVQATNTLLAYVLDKSPEKITFLERLAKRHALELKLKGANDDISRDDSIERWLSEIRNASMIVTDSFHGTVFSILFHRPFLSIINRRRGAERFISLLSLLDLKQQLVYDVNTYEFEGAGIDWLKVDKLLTSERYKSICFLKEALT